MLDLNLDTFTGAGRRRDTSDATAVAKAKNLKEDSRTVTEDEGSGTSCSSVIIAGEETTSTGGGGGGSCGFITFDILKRQGQETPQKEGNNPSPEYSTFPAAAGEEGFSSFASGEGQKWLKLSSPWCTSEVGKIGSSSNNNNHRSIRKSRRGPRSRSSPYRGVTFYRRTGRWESHIW